MAYKYNPFLSGLDNTVDASAFTILGTEPNLAAIQAKPTPSSGDVWQAADTGIFYVYDATAAAWESLGTLAGPAGPAGATGATGADGADGADGQTILNGNGAPVDNVTGTDGDFYIDTSAHTIYGPRTAGAWGSPTSLVAGGATTLGGLTDVDLTTSPPTNGEALVYDSVNSEWVPGSAGATAAGSVNQIQYNDGAGGLAASADFTVNVDWDNPSTTFTALKVNVPDATQGASDSKLLDLQSGGTSKLFVTNTGAIRLAGQGGGSPRLIYDQYGHGLGGISGGASLMSGGAARIWALGGGAGTTSLYFTASSASPFSTAAALVYDTDDFTIAQRNGTNAQTFRVYNTLTGTDVSATGNYERGFLQWNSNVLELGTEAGSGGGSEQPVRITAATLKLPNLPTYADNTAATSGGLVAGDVYKTATGELRITV